MAQRHRYEWIFFKGVVQQQWLSLLLGIVLTIAVLGVWQEVLQEELRAGVRSSLPNVVLFGGVIGAWTLVFTVYLGQRSERYARQSRKINQQLQQEIVERQRIETELRFSEVSMQERESTLRSFFNNESMLMGIVELHDWDILHISDNQAAANFFGTTQSAMQNRFASEMGVPRSHLQSWISAYRAAEQTQKPVHFEYLHETSTGQRWLAATVCQIASGTSQRSRFSYVVEDITDRKQVEDALEKELLRSRTLLNTSVDGIVILNPQGNVVQTSSSFAEMLGYTVEETLQLNVVDWDAQWTREELQQILKESIELPPVFETRHRRKDGSLYDVEISYNRVEIDGEMMHFCICRDVGERKRAEELLKFSQARYEALVSNMPGMVYRYFPNTVDSPHHFTFVSSHSDELLELAPEVIIRDANAFVNLIDPEDLSSFLSSVAYAVEHFLPWHWEGRIIMPSGRVKWIEGNSQAQHTSEGAAWDGILIDISDRKQTEIALQNSQARFAGILEIASDAIISVNASQQITLFNKGAEHIFGYRAEEVLGQPLALLMPDRFAQSHCYHVKQYAHNGSQARQMAQRGAIFGRRKDGTEFPAEASISKLNLNGEIIFTTFLRDISERVRLEAERQQVEEALRRSEATKQAIIQAIPDLLIRMRIDGSYVEFISNSHFNIFNPDQHREKVNLYDILPIDLAQLRIHYTQQALQSGEVQVYEHEIWIEGKQCYEEVRIVPLPEDEVLVMVRDTTDRKQFEEDLRHQKEMFQVIVDHIPVMIALFNDQGRIDFINPEFERVLGWSLQEWQQRDVMVDLYPDPIYLQSVLDHMTAAMGNWKDFTTLTATKQQIETSWTNVPISKGRFLGIGQDVSDRKRKETALRQAMEAAEAANLAKSMFLANMSHELRTPLNVILGFAQVMSHDSSLTSAQLEDLKTIQRSGDHLLNLINDVLDLSKIEAGHCTLEESGFDLISLLHTLRTMMVERVTAKHLQLIFEIAPEVPQFVIADEQKLRQVLLNLLSNAIKFTKQGSVTLQVTSWESSEKTCLVSNALHHDDSPKRLISGAACILQFEVSDTGVGIAETEQESIFDAFAQAEAGRQSIGGTGLGLTISRRLLELMDGSISVKSTLGLGSTFTVTVPVCPTSGVDGLVEQQERTIIGLVPGQRHRRILVVDDQRENRRLLVRLLTRLGLEVQEATNGQEAIALWQQWQPDLTWMDIRMPGLDGYEATKQIRAMEHGQASVIIALTAQASQSDRALALAAGCNDYISKPFREETLFLKLKEYLSLEYLYDEASDLGHSPSISTLTSTLDPNADRLSSFDPAMLIQVPSEWLETLEDLALCGNDRAIVDLINQLAPEFESFKAQLLDLANRCEFEQMIHLIRRGASP